MQMGSTVILPIRMPALHMLTLQPLYTPHSPGHAPGWWWRVLRPRKRAMEQFKVSVSSWSSFPVINREATSQLLFKMLHPRAQAPSQLWKPRSEIQCH